MMQGPSQCIVRDQKKGFLFPPDEIASVSVSAPPPPSLTDPPFAFAAALPQPPQNPHLSNSARPHIPSKRRANRRPILRAAAFIPKNTTLVFFSLCVFRSTSQGACRPRARAPPRPLQITPPTPLDQKPPPHTPYANSTAGLEGVAPVFLAHPPNSPARVSARGNYPFLRAVFFSKQKKLPKAPPVQCPLFNQTCSPGPLGPIAFILHAYPRFEFPHHHHTKRKQKQAAAPSKRSIKGQSCKKNGAINFTNVHTNECLHNLLLKTNKQNKKQALTKSCRKSPRRPPRPRPRALHRNPSAPS
jgi:hypothetical protein